MTRFAYLKHSPLQDQRTERLLVGAARITRVTPPPMWNQSGNPPFATSMWETIVEHSLRPDKANGILLPYQELIPLLDDGVDVDATLAWAPEGRVAEFSYVTERLSDDAAEALTSLQAAAEGIRDLGVAMPDAGLDWVQAEIERLWQLRGPVPGLPGILNVIKHHALDKPHRDRGESRPRLTSPRSVRQRPDQDRGPDHRRRVGKGRASKPANP